MAADDARRDEVRSWLMRAATDLRAGHHDLAADPPLTEDSLFHAQQATEKAMKAYLAWHDRAFPRTHDLSLLGSRCTEIDESLEGVMRRVAPLTVYAWEYRYPGQLSDPAVGDASEALDLAGVALAEVRRRLPEDLDL